MNDMKTEDQTEFAFDQLDARAKEVARDVWRAQELNDEWWDSTYEDAIRIGALVGIEIGTCPYKCPAQEPEIWFSLYTQGSGACFSGTLQIARLDGCQARLAEEIGTESDGDKSLHALAAIGQALYHQIVLRAFTRRLTGPDPADEGWGDINEISLNAHIAIEGNDSYYATKVCGADNCPEEIGRAMNDYVTVFASWLYHQLEAEADYLTSDEHVDQAIQDSGLLFDEFGSTI